MKVYAVQWKYHDDTMTCGIFNSLAMAKDAQQKVIDGLGKHFFKGWTVGDPYGPTVDVNIYEWELDIIICEEAGFTPVLPSDTTL